MADTKITGLAALTGANAADGDVLPVVDVSDTSMAASGTTKNMTMAELAVAVGGGARLVLEPRTSSPSAPSAGVKLYSRATGRTLPFIMGPSGQETPLMPHIGANKAAWFQCTGNATTVVTPGITLTTIGTATIANWANTNMFTNSRRLSYISGAAAGSAGGWRENVLKYSIGASGWGGFHIMGTMGFLTLPAGYRVFMGLYGTAGVIGNVDPSSLVNLIGIGKDTGDTNLQFMHNDSGGTATKIDTGIALATSDVLDFRIFCPSGGSTIYFAARKVNGGGAWVTSDSSVTAPTNVPSATQGLAIQNWCNNNATASAIDPHWMSYYIETDI